MSAFVLDPEPSPRCQQALDEIDRLVDAREAVDRSAFLKMYADVAEELAAHWAMADLVVELGHSRAETAVRPNPDEAIKSFGDYEVLERIGHGGMGTVFKARQKSLNRLVALKFPTGGALAGAEAVERCRQEALALAQLGHPHIVGIYEVGLHEGRPYLSMEYVPGRDLAQLLQTEPPERRQAVEYVRTIAAAIDHAHQRNIVHRDLKPANILLSDAGVIRIADFGLGKDLMHDNDLTHTGQILGTLRYTAPEQINETGRGSPQAGDIYALGAILYELLSGRQAFWAQTTALLIRQIIEHDPPPLRQFDQQIPIDLETICQKCLSKNPAERYATAGALADDLQRFLEGRPISARRASAAQRVSKWARRNKSAVTSILAIGGALILALFALLLFERNHFLLREADWLRQLSDVQRIRQMKHRTGWSNATLSKIRQAAQVRSDDTVIREAAACLVGMDLIKRNDWNIRSSSVAFNSDSTQLLIGGGIAGNTRIWQAETDTFQESRQSGLGPVAFNRRGDGLQWTVSAPLTFVLWNVSRQEPVCRIQAPLADFEIPPEDSSQLKQLANQVTLAMSRDGTLVTASIPIPGREGEVTYRSGVTFVWNDRGEVQRRIEGEATGLCFSPDNSLLAIGRADGTIEVLSLIDERVATKFKSSDNRIHCLDFQADPRRTDDSSHWLLAAGDAGSMVVVWDVARQVPYSRCGGSAYDVFAVAFSPDGMTLAAGGREGAHIWETLTGKPILDVHGTGDYISGLAYSGDGAQLAIASRGPAQSDLHATTVWDVQSGRGIDLLYGMSSQVVQTCLSADGRLLVALGQDWKISVFELKPPKLLQVLQGPVGFSSDNAALALREDNRLLAASAGSDALVFDLNSGVQMASFKLPPGMVDQLAFTKDGRLLSFRSECQDGHTAPLADADATSCPRVLRLRNLLGENPSKPLAEIPRFNAYVYFTVAHPQGAYFVADGLHRKPDGDVQEIIAFDGRSGEAIWKYTHTSPDDAPTLTLDPTGGTLGFYDRATMQAKQVRLPSGEVLAQSAPFAHALGPHGDTTLSNNYIDLNAGIVDQGFAYYQRDSKTPTVVLGSDFMVHGISPRFSRDGRLLAFGTKEGLVAVCDLSRLTQILSEIAHKAP